jgi:methyl-accepting chemotaxis protein
MAFSLAEEAKRAGAERREAVQDIAAVAMAADAIASDLPLSRAMEMFRQFPRARFLAVVDSRGRPVGALHEQVVRDLLFSPFGHALLANPGCRWTLAEMVRPCPVAEIDASIEALIAAHGSDAGIEGMILTRAGRYVALLPSQALVRLAARREREAAEVAITRGRALECAFDRFRAEAADFVAALGSAAEDIRHTAAGVAERAARNGAQATAVAAASSQGADGIAEVAASSAELARQGGMIERRVIEAEQAVAAAVGHVATGARKAERLAQAADAIGSIVHLITEISGKVNMLAINATIEAARAGEAGRSFAVVAGEVKNLANQAGAAARGIEAQIGAVRAAVADSAEANLAIAEIVAQVEDATAQIRGSVLEQSMATTMIAATVEQCAVASAQISTHVGEMGSRAATAGDMALRLGGVAEGLGARAEALRGRVDIFLEEIRAG